MAKCSLWQESAAYFPARILLNFIFAITVSIRPFPLEIQHSAGRLAYSVTTCEFLSLDSAPASFTHVSQARDQDEERNTEPEDQLNDSRQRVLLDFQNSQVRVFRFAREARVRWAVYSVGCRPFIKQCCGHFVVHFAGGFESTLKEEFLQYRFHIMPFLIGCRAYIPFSNIRTLSKWER